LSLAHTVGLGVGMTAPGPQTGSCLMRSWRSSSRVRLAVGGRHRQSAVGGRLLGGHLGQVNTRGQMLALAALGASAAPAVAKQHQLLPEENGWSWKMKQYSGAATFARSLGVRLRTPVMWLGNTRALSTTCKRRARARRGLSSNLTVSSSSILRQTASGSSMAPRTWSSSSGPLRPQTLKTSWATRI